MAITKVSVKYVGQSVFSPFTGAVADGPDGPNENDPSLLFVHYGNAGLYAYISKTVIDHLHGEDTADIEGLTPDELIDQLSLPNAFALEVDTSRDGTKYYGFAAFEPH